MEDSRSWQVATRDADRPTIVERSGNDPGDDDREDEQRADEEAPEELVTDGDAAAGARRAPKALQEPPRLNGGRIEFGRHRAARGRRH
jgi:hypothetical protein